MVKFADAGNKKRYERREWVDRTTSEVLFYDHTVHPTYLCVVISADKLYWITN